MAVFGQSAFQTKCACFVINEKNIYFAETTSYNPNYLQHKVEGAVR